jgi:lipopolysaccharide/colanic/teichoic acid biosynthesis glycosyltransferase
MIRIFDVIVASVAIVVLSPVLALVALLIRISLGSPILFRQNRLGAGGKPFKILKFRTMLDAIDASGNQLPDGERLTPFGAFLRSASLDELPGLINVIRGEMSLVGPRPLVVEYLPLYSVLEARRHEVRPGITGWAQVNGRNSISWDEKFELDIWYVDNQSFWLDIKILLLTIKKVFVRDGISGDGEVTMHRFTGSASAVGKKRD